MLVEAFTHPHEVRVLRLLDGDLLADIAAAIGALPMSIKVPPAADIPSGIDSIRDTQGIYTDLFDITSGSPNASLLERRYGEVPEQQLWEDVLRYYRYFGLNFSDGYASEQPDHLLTELSFMHYLCFLEAGAKGRHESFRRGQRDFLANHLAKWSRSLADKIGEAAHPGPYATLANLLDKVLQSDIKLLNASLSELWE